MKRMPFYRRPGKKGKFTGLKERHLDDHQTWPPGYGV
jgi:hypothetical protein